MAKRISVRAKAVVAIRCVYCHELLGPKEASVSCPTCHTDYHSVCAKEQGRCGILGCVGTLPGGSWGVPMIAEQLGRRHHQPIRDRTVGPMPYRYRLAGALIHAAGLISLIPFMGVIVFALLKGMTLPGSEPRGSVSLGFRFHSRLLMFQAGSGAGLFGVAAIAAVIPPLAIPSMLLASVLGFFLIVSLLFGNILLPLIAAGQALAGAEVRYL